MGSAPCSDAGTPGWRVFFRTDLPRFLLATSLDFAQEREAVRAGEFWATPMAGTFIKCSAAWQWPELNLLVTSDSCGTEK